MYGLRRIIQIDGFIPDIRTVVELDGHSIISGANGAGKSSTLKLLSFFYGSDPSQLDSHAAGRDPFVQFYLPRQTSLLVFEYARESGLCCAVAYRHKNGTKHVYRFLEGGFSEECFSHKDTLGKAVYCKGHELKLHWRQLGLTCSQQIEVVTDYRAIIQNDSSLINRLADSRSLRRLATGYCLGSRKTHMRYIDRICAAIISRSGNMERMKDMLADIMVEDGVIFPETPIHRADVALAKEISSLREFGKEVPQMKAVLARHYERLDIETRLTSYGGQVKQAAIDLGEEFEQANQAVINAEDRLHQLELGWDSEYSELNRQVIVAGNEVDSREGKIERLGQQYDAYEEQDMEQKVLDFDNLGQFMEDAGQARARHKKLIDDVEEEESAHNRHLNDEYERFVRVRDATQKKLDRVKESRRKKTQEYSSNRELVLARESAEIDAIREQATPAREALIKAKATAEADADTGGATEEERLSLAEILQRVEELEREANAESTVLEVKKSALESVRNRRNSANEALGHAKSSLHTKRDERTELHKLAFAEDGTWLRRLREKNPNWADRLGKVISPDLLQRKDLHAEYTNEELDTIFGWSVNLNAIATPHYAETEVQLRTEYSVQEEVVRIAEQVVSERETDCAKANRQYKEAELAANEAQTSVRRKSGQKEDADKTYRAVNREINDAIAERRIAAKKKIQRLQNEISDFDQELNERIGATKERHKEELSELQGAWGMEESRISQEIDRLSKELEAGKEDHRKRKKQIKEDFEEACSDKGVDSKTIKSAKSTADEAQAKVQSIHDSAGAVSTYREWLATEWRKRDSLIRVLGEWKAKREQVKNQLKDRERNHKHQKKQLEAEKASENSRLRKLNRQKEQLNSIRPRFSFYMDKAVAVSPLLPFDLLIAEVQSLLDSNDKLKEDLVEDMRRINNKIGHFDETQVGQAWLRAKDNLRKQLNYDDPYSRDFLISLPQALEVFIDEEVNSIKLARIESLRGIGKGLTDFFEHLRVIHNRIKHQSRKITSAIEENMKIEALSSMGISLESRIDSLDYWKSLQDFSRSWQEWRESDENELPGQQFLDEMSLLIDALQSIKSGRHLRDYFDLHIRMVENGHERMIKNDYQLDNSTSDGLKYLALCVIFIAISRLLCPDREVLLHWPIDELGLLHGENISRLFSMLGHGGIVMVGGFPSEDPVMLRHFRHRQVIDFKKGIRVIDIPESTLRERALARRNLEVINEHVS